ncbi:hypothetical protein OK074_3173 [Actinobacteria bacterium OK074]|nr:hypothetical protein OK074_3173 [Actinobacteria bacterium OK074]
MRRRRRTAPDGDAFWSGVLTLLSVAGLLATIIVALTVHPSP